MSSTVPKPIWRSAVAPPLARPLAPFCLDQYPMTQAIAQSYYQCPVVLIGEVWALLVNSQDLPRDLHSLLVGSRDGEFCFPDKIFFSALIRGDRHHFKGQRVSRDQVPSLFIQFDSSRY